MNKTGGGISAEGARVLGKALLVNTTLTSLNLAGEHQRKSKPNNEIALMEKTKKQETRSAVKEHVHWAKH